MTLNVERFLVESYPPPPAPSPNLGSGGTYPQNACIFTISVCLHGLQARHRKICKYCPLSQKNSGPFPWAWGKIWFYCERYSNVTSTTNVNYCKKKVWWPMLHGIDPSARKNVCFQQPCPMNSTIDCSEGAQRNPSPRTTSWVWQQCFRTSIQLISNLTA